MPAGRGRREEIETRREDRIQKRTVLPEGEKNDAEENERERHTVDCSALCLLIVDEGVVAEVVGAVPWCNGLAYKYIEMSE